MLVYTATTGAMSGKTSLAEGLAAAEQSNIDRLHARLIQLMTRDDMVEVMAKARSAARAAEMSLAYTSGRQWGKTELARKAAKAALPLRARGWKWRR